MGVLYAHYVPSLLAHIGNDSDQRTISPAVPNVASVSRADSGGVRPAVGGPSGLWMAFCAETGAIAGAGFAALAAATGMCVALGWRSAMNRRFAAHQRWTFQDQDDVLAGKSDTEY